MPRRVRTTAQPQDQRPTNEQKQSQIWLSWRVAKSRESAGLMVRRKKLARATPQYNSKSHAHCKSCMAGILFKNVACSPILDCNCSTTNSRVPTGVPKMVIPLSLGSLWRSPLHTLASGSSRVATACRSSILVGASPLLLKTQVFP